MKSNLYRAWIIVFFTALVFVSCKPDRDLEKNAERPADIKPLVVAPEFNADSAYYYIRKQVEFGPRIPNTPSHFQTGTYLETKLKSFNAVVESQEFQESTYNGEILSLKNIIASFHPEKSRRILLGAHWDTRPFSDKDAEKPQIPFDGANDGGSGVGVLLEIARVVSMHEPKNAGIDIIFFDGEDYGEPDFYEGEILNTSKIYWCLGSQYWSKNKHKRNYMAYYGILLDMVGGRGATFYKEGGSMQYAKKVVEKVWDAGHKSGFSQYFINQTSPGITDDHIFVNRDAKIPMINIVEYDPEDSNSYFGPYHHTQNDNMDLIDKGTLKAVGQTLLHVIYNE
jgi:Zn-dependent M28 family amino/carboxypeptidase